jgi:sugar phosphate isomerase/epimerase
MQISICSYSFHRLLAAGKQDMFQYIRDCKKLGCTHLQPWNAHFSRTATGDSVVQLGRTPGSQGTPDWLEPPTDKAYVSDIRQAARDAGMPFELIAVDRAYIYDKDPQVAKENRSRAYQWMDLAETLGAQGMRIDAGGPEQLTDDILRIVIDGYNDLIKRGKDKGVSIFIENHWGSSCVPENIVKYKETIDGLKLLFDTNNWAPNRQKDGWRMCAKYAAATHVKTFEFDAAGNEIKTDIPEAIRLVVEAGFKGIWGVESVPRDGNEIDGAAKTIALIKKCLAKSR